MDKFIDVSYHKGYMDLQKVKDAGYEAAILKCSDGFFMPDDMEGSSWDGHIDPSFYLYWKQTKELFDWRACYHFLRVDDEVAIKNGRPTSLEQIDIFYNAVKEEGLYWDDYIILDIEQAASQTDYLSKAVIAERVKQATIKTEELFGRKPIIYTGAWWWEMYHQYFDRDFFSNYPFWLSHYWSIDSNNDIKYNGYNYYLKDNRVFPEAWMDNLEDRLAYCRIPIYNNVPTINPDMVWMWQYTASGRMDGINASVDTNYYMSNNKTEGWGEAQGESTEPPVEPPQPPDGLCTVLRYIKTALDSLLAFITKKLEECE